MKTSDEMTTRELEGLLVVLESIEKMQCIASSTQIAEMLQGVKEKYPFLESSPR